MSWRGLMSACRSLQSLTLDQCRLKEVRISGLPNLKSFSITACASTRLVEIQAPSLESFSFHHHDYCYRGRKLPACMISMDRCPNLKSLVLEQVAEDDRWFRDFTSRFPRLQALRLFYCNSLTRIRISTPMIESVYIFDCRNLTGISIEAPELRRFDLVTLYGRLPPISLKNPPSNDLAAKVRVFYSEQQPPAGWSCKLRKFLVGSCKSFSSLVFTADSKDGCACELRSDIKYGWSGVIACHYNQLHLARRSAKREALAKAVGGTDVTGLLWTPHPATVTAVAAGWSGDDFLQLFCDKASEIQRYCSKKECTCYANGAKIVIATGSCSN